MPIIHESYSINGTIAKNNNIYSTMVVSDFPLITEGKQVYEMTTVLYFTQNNITYLNGIKSHFIDIKCVLSSGRWDCKGTIYKNYTIFFKTNEILYDIKCTNINTDECKLLIIQYNTPMSEILTWTIIIGGSFLIIMMFICLQDAGERRQKASSSAIRK